MNKGRENAISFLFFFLSGCTQQQRMDVAAVASPAAVSDIEDAHDMIQIIDEDGGWV
jgi:hypothetical protein